MPDRRYVVVNTVNTPLSRAYDFGVHAFGCADLTRSPSNVCQQYPHAAPDASAVVDAERRDLAESFGEDPDVDLGFTFRILPCSDRAPAAE